MNQNNPKDKEVFPFKPDSVKEHSMHIFKDDDFNTDAQIYDIVRLMFEYPEREFYLFHNASIQLSSKIISAEKQNIILLNKVDCFYYEHPQKKKNYIKTSGNNSQIDWQKELIKNNQEYHRYTLKLTKKAKLDLEIAYKNSKKKRKIKKII
ncbi:MAG: hypothetical protein KAI43_02370 [Candidatus Aureabacteria bacterium]|nr:hypothetical protein [Candidatus Auribacterota bacterium]